VGRTRDGFIAEGLECWWSPIRRKRKARLKKGVERAEGDVIRKYRKTYSRRRKGD